MGIEEEQGHEKQQIRDTNAEHFSKLMDRLLSDEQKATLEEEEHNNPYRKPRTVYKDPIKGHKRRVHQQNVRRDKNGTTD